MTDIRFSTTVACPPDEVRPLLLTRGLLGEFVTNQQVRQHDIVVNEQDGTAVVTATHDLADAGVMGKALGSEMVLEVRIATQGDLRIDVEVRSRVKGSMSSTVTVTPVPEGARLDLDGTLRMSGLLGRASSGLVGDFLVKSLLEEELFPLLGKWSRNTA